MKRLIRECMAYFGYSVIKSAPKYLFKKELQVHVGKFTLLMPVSNPLIHTYRQQPEFATEITRLTAACHNKYPDLVFLDIGANTGDTIARVKAVADIPVIAVEGDDISFSYLERNCKQFNQVTLFKQFLGETDTELSVQLKKKGWNTTLVPDESGGETIQVRKIDSLYDGFSYSITRMKIFKLDTEGFDTIILRGAFNFIREAKPVIFLEYNRDNMKRIQENGLNTILGLKDLGYDSLLFYDDRGRFLLSTKLNEGKLIHELNSYADGVNGLIYYYNIALFHSSDTDLAEQVIQAEMNHQATG